MEGAWCILDMEQMLYADSCVVLFYQSFNTQYSYTRIGHIEDVTDLMARAGSGGLQVRFDR